MRMLLSEGLITAEDLDRAQGRAAARGGTLCHRLVESGVIGADELLRFLVRRFPLPMWPRQRLEILPAGALSAVSAAHARALRVLPVASGDGRLTVALADPTDSHAAGETARAAGAPVDLVLVSDDDLSFALELHYGESGEGAQPGDGAPLPLVRRASRVDDAARAMEEEAIPLVRRAVKPVAVAVSDGDSWSIEPLSPPAPGPEPGPGPPREEPPPRELSEGELIAAIGGAKDRGAVIDAALAYLKRFADRAAFFAVKRTEIRGVRIHDDRVRSESAQALFLPLAAPSTLRRVAEERQVYVGALDRTAADAVLSAALGGRPERVLAIPVVVGGRTAGIFLADGFSSVLPPGARLERFSVAVSEALSALIVRGKMP